jgi:pyruvate/2-oxoglutarate dehydrogenase complex dihydrolipoamide acyltransferase (E2) component
VSETQKFRLRSAGYKRDIVAPVGDNDTYVDRESGTEFVVVGQVLPVGGQTKSSLPWAEENLRLCGCSREQLVQKDVNDCPYCDRRIPAAEGAAAATSTVAATITAKAAETEAAAAAPAPVAEPEPEPAPVAEAAPVAETPVEEAPAVTDEAPAEPDATSDAG